MNKLHLAAMMSASVALAACGGGGGQDPAAPVSQGAALAQGDSVPSQQLAATWPGNGFTFPDFKLSTSPGPVAFPQTLQFPSHTPPVPAPAPIPNPPPVPAPAPVPNPPPIAAPGPLTAPAPAPGPAAAPAPGVLVNVPASAYKAMWTWNDSEVMTAAARERMVSFAANNKITSIYVQAEGLMSGYPDQLTALINLAATRSITIELLFADPNWVFTSNHQYVINLIQRANAYVGRLTGAKPVGYHFDVEPHTLPGWASDQVGYGNQLIDLYSKVLAVRQSGIQVNVDIALGYRDVLITRNGIVKSLSQRLIDATDKTTIMAYRDHALGADSVTYFADHPVNYAAQVGKQTYVGVETQCNLQPTKITFCEEGPLILNAELAKLYQYYKGNPGFGGTALHEYRSLQLAPYAGTTIAGN